MAIIPAHHDSLSFIGHIALIRASNTSSHSRWGDINLLGVITHNSPLDVELYNLQHYFDEGQNLLKPRSFKSSVQRQLFTRVTDTPAANEKQFFVPNGFCMLDQLNLRDSRPFYRINRNDERQLCLLTITGPDPHSGPNEHSRARVRACACIERAAATSRGETRGNSSRNRDEKPFQAVAMAFIL